MKNEGKATILFSREEGLLIELEDAKSGICITAKLNHQEAINALSRLALVDCEIEYPDNGLHLIGKTREIKEAYLPCRFSYGTPRKEVLAGCVLEGLLVDGWELWQDGLSTQQRERQAQSYFRAIRLTRGDL